MSVIVICTVSVLLRIRMRHDQSSFFVGVLHSPEFLYSLEFLHSLEFQHSLGLLHSVEFMSVIVIGTVDVLLHVRTRHGQFYFSLE